MPALIFEGLLKMSLVASGLILLILLLRKFLKYKLPAITFLLLWAFVFVKLIIPLSIPSPISPFNYLPRESYSTADAVRHTQEKLINQTPPFSDGSFTPPDAAQETPVPAVAEKEPVSFLTVCFWIWLAVFAAGLCILGTAYFLQIKRLRTAAFWEYRPDGMPSEQKQIRRKIRIGTLSGISSPLTFGVFRPVILVPKAYLEFDRQKLALILTHEYNHIRQWDSLWNICTLTIACIHWFNPIVWAALHYYRRDTERFCDERVLRRLSADQNLEYAHTLLDAARISRRTHALLPSAFSGHSLKERIRFAALYQKKTVITAAFSILLVVCIFTTFTTKAMLAEAPDDPSPPTEESRTQPVPAVAQDPVDPGDMSSLPTSTAQSQPDTQPTDLTTPFVPTTLPAVERIEIWDHEGNHLPSGSLKQLGCAMNAHQYDLYLTARIFPENAENTTVVWSSDDPTIAQVDQNGVVTMISEGETMIRATASNGVTSSFIMHPYTFRTGCIRTELFISIYYQNKKIDDVLILPYQVRIGKLVTIFMDLPLPQKPPNDLPQSAPPFFSSAETRYSYHWLSSDPDKIDVYDNGNIIVKQPGSSVVITVLCDTVDGFSAQFTVISEKGPT